VSRPLTSDENHQLVDRVRRNKISSVIAQSIVCNIANHRLRPGSPLPTEQAMASQYGAGRASVREALRLLESQGIIDIRRGNGGGPVVGTSAAERFGETMTMHMQIRGASMNDLHETVISLAPLQAERAAILVRDGAADAGAVAAMVEESRHDLARDADGVLSSREFVESGRGFHTLIQDINPNPVLDLVTEAVSHIYATRAAAGGVNFFPQNTRMRLHLDHIRIADAVQGGQPDLARQLMHDHQIVATRAIFEVYPDLSSQLVEWE
jgi:GntR family transcriptional regulator, transcriptional repressor for pyruvate dehydrogenase complex